MNPASSEPLPTDETPDILMAGVLRVPMEAISFAMSRSSGPGGQNVNKVNTRVELRLPLSAIANLSEPILQRLRMLAGKKLIAAGELRLVCQETRSQEANRAASLEMLRVLLEEASKLPKPRRATRPTRGSKRRRIEGKKHQSATKAGRSHRGQED